MTPDIYLFNPTCELAVANGSVNFMAPAPLRRFEDELGALPGILAQSKDIVLLNQRPPQKYLDQLNHAGFQLPTYLTTDRALTDPEFLVKMKGLLYPWGWNPAIHKLLSPLKPGCSIEYLESPVAEWRETHRELYSRKSALMMLKRIVEESEINYLLSEKDLPEICTTHEQIQSLQSRWGKVVVKAPWSSSGRGLQILRQNEYNQTNQQVISGFLRQQGFVAAGPWHDKVLDLSLQFFSFGNGRIDYRGFTSFSTDHLGRYNSTYLQELPPDLAPEIQDFIEENLEDVKIALHQALIASNYSTNYYGWLGVDMLIFRSPDGRLKIQPCLEINCRFTMGAIALSLRNHLAEGSEGAFRITHSKEGNLSQFCDEMIKKEPLILENGQIIRGFLPLTPALPGSCFGAWCRITKEINGNS